MASESPVAAQSVIIRVDAATGSDSDNGSTWALAKATIQGALAAAQAVDGSVEIWVKEYTNGAYVPSAKLDPSSSDNRLRSFLIQAINDDADNFLQLRGGFPASISSPTANDRNGLLYVTRLSGDQGSGVHSYHVVTTALADERTRVDGFDISGGSSEDAEEEGYPDYVTDSNSIGAGVFCICPPPSEVGTLIVWSPLIANCFIHDNLASLGGGIGASGLPSGLETGRREVNVVAQLCRIYDNDAGAGAGIGVDTSDVEASNCVLVGNVAVSNGGGIFAGGDSATAVVRGCTIADNTVDPLFSGRGGGLYVSGVVGGSGAVVWNSIIYGNDSPTGGVLDEIASSSVLGNPSGTYGIAPYDSCIGFYPVPNPTTGQNVINDDPDFISPANGDYRLADGSPCIDAGSIDTPLEPYESYVKMPDDTWDADDDGDTEELLPAVNRKLRDRGCAIDMGAHERNACVGDVNDSGLVSGADLAILLGAWGPVWGNDATDEENACDINEDGEIDGADLALLTGDYSCEWDCEGDSLTFRGEGGPDIDLFAAAEVYGFTDLNEFGLWLGGYGPDAALDLLAAFTTSGGGES